MFSNGRILTFDFGRSLLLFSYVLLFFFSTPDPFPVGSDFSFVLETKPRRPPILLPTPPSTGNYLLEVVF